MGVQNLSHLLFLFKVRSLVVGVAVEQWHGCRNVKPASLAYSHDLYIFAALRVAPFELRAIEKSFSFQDQLLGFAERCVAHGGRRVLGRGNGGSFLKYSRQLLG